MSLGRRLSEFGRANVGRIVFIAAVILVLGIWMIHVRLNDDGIVTGVVLTEEGKPVAGATVQIREQTLNLIKQPRTVQTDEQGHFEFTDIEMIEFVVSAKREGIGASERHHYHLYFMRQDFQLPEPLILKAGS
jgi:flagellar biosynthesis protein FliQ